MSTEVYAIASGKGGVGKTTTTLNVAIALRRAGHSVALVDCDIGMANLADLLSIDHSPTLHDVLAGRADVDEAVTEYADQFAVLPGDRSLGAYADVETDGLAPVLEAVAEEFDFVLVDTGPSLSYDDVLPLGLVDGIVLVTTPAPTAIGDTQKTAEIARLMETSITGVVVNRGNARTDGREIAAELDADLLGVVPDTPAIQESTAAGESLWKDYQSSEAAEVYLQIVAVLTEGAEPITEVEAADQWKTIGGTPTVTTSTNGDTTPTTSNTNDSTNVTPTDGAATADGASTAQTDDSGGDDSDEQAASAQDTESPEPATVSAGAAAESASGGDAQQPKTNETSNEPVDESADERGDGGSLRGWLQRLFS